MEMHQLRYVVAAALTRKRTIRTTDLEHESLIVMKEVHCLNEQVLGLCDRQGLRPKITFRSAQIETVQALVRAGLGISLIPAKAANSKRADLRSTGRYPRRNPAAPSSPCGPRNAGRDKRRWNS